MYSNKYRMIKKCLRHGMMPMTKDRWRWYRIFDISRVVTQLLKNLQLSTDYSRKSWNTKTSIINVKTLVKFGSIYL